MQECIFCKIISGEIPSSKVYEDEYVYAFNDINPMAPVHILVIPKKHVANVMDINSENSDMISEFMSITFATCYGHKF